MSPQALSFLAFFDSLAVGSSSPSSSATVSRAFLFAPLDSFDAGLEDNFKIGFVADMGGLTPNVSSVVFLEMSLLTIFPDPMFSATHLLPFGPFPSSHPALSANSVIVLSTSSNAVRLPTQSVLLDHPTNTSSRSHYGWWPHWSSHPHFLPPMMLP